MILKKLFVCSAMLMLVLSACDDKKAAAPKAPPPVSVKLDTVKTTDAVYYEPFTYLDGVMEKYVPGDLVAYKLITCPKTSRSTLAL